MSATAKPTAAVSFRAHSRRLEIGSDALGRYAALAAGRPTVGFLLREEAQRAVAVLDPLLTIRGRGRCVTVRTEGAGMRLLTPLAAALAGRGLVKQGASSLEFLAATQDPDLDEHARLLAPGPFDLLRTLLLGDAVLSVADPADRLLLGAFGYDLVDAFERLPAPRLAAAASPLDLMLAGTRIEFDLARGMATVVVLEPADASATETALALGRLADLVRALGRPVTAPPLTDPVAAQVDLDASRFGALVTRLQVAVREGEVFQIVPSRCYSAPCADALGALRRLVAINPSAYAFHLRSAGRELFGASPETAVAVSGRRVRLTPIAGTRPRGRDADGSLDTERDARAMASLHLDTKETAEHMMLVDLARNDLARVAVPGSRVVHDLLTITRHSHVMHLASRIEAELAPGLDALHALIACLNPGTLTGAPRLRAMALLRGVEPQGRGAYGGAFGVIQGTGDMDLGIVIRSAEVSAGRAEVRVGAGVVLDSDPRAEAEETRRKASAVLQALGVREVPA